MALPNNNDEPSFSLKLAPNFLVTLLVTGDLGLPKLGVGLGYRIVLAAIVAVPKTAMDEDNGAVLGKDDVGGAGEAFVVYPVSESLVP